MSKVVSPKIKNMYEISDAKHWITDCYKRVSELRLRTKLCLIVAMICILVIYYFWSEHQKRKREYNRFRWHVYAPIPNTNYEPGEKIVFS